MSKKHRNRESWDAAPSQPFVSVLKPTLQEPAWKAMSYGARCLYITLKSYFNGKNNGRLYLSVRRAADDLGAGTTSVERWFRELQDFGWIRSTEVGRLGLDGHGQATCWRLTELGFMGDQPTREYREWLPKKNPSPKRGVSVPKMGTDLPQNGDGCPRNGDGFGPNRPDNCPRNGDTYTSPYDRGGSSDPSEEAIKRAARGGISSRMKASQG